MRRGGGVERAPVRRSLGTGVLGSRRRSSAVLVAIALLALPSGVGCQTSPARRRDVKTVDITSVRRRIEFTARVRDVDQESKVGAGDTSTEEAIFEESIRIETEGSVYHPNFMEFTLAGLFGLLQHDFDENFGNRRRTFGEEGDILEFDIEGRFLKKKPYPGTVFARRYRTLQPRPFLSSLETTTTGFGFTWQYVSTKTPTSIQFSDTEVDLDPLDDREQEGLQKNTSLRFETEYRFADHNILSFTYDREEVEERPFALDFTSDELTLAHRLDFGPGLQHRLESELVYFDQVGSFDIRRWRWRETLRLQHTESLRSWYRFELLDRVQGSLAGVVPIGETAYYLSGTLEHKLYDSLISELFAFGQVQDFDSGLTIRRAGFQPSIDYRKKNPWGVLLGSYIFRLQREDREGANQTVEILDEGGTFTDPEPVILTNANVMLGSVFITAEDRTTQYRNGEDYTLRAVGDTVEIERVPTGRIRDGERILIDYRFLLAGDFTLNTTMHNVSVQQNFRFGLSPYYRLRRQNQEISPRGATGVQPEDITAHIVGATYEKGPIRLSAEYEDHDSNINPFEAVRLSADASRRLFEGGTGRVRARWTDIDRSGRQNRRTKFLTLEARYRQRIGGALSFEGAVLYRRERDSASGNDRGVDIDLALELVTRQTEIRLTYENGRFEDDFAKNKTQALFLQYRRRF